MACAICTGNVRPGTVNTGASSKYVENFSLSSVAEVITSFSSRVLTSFFNNPNNISVCNERS